MSDSYEFLKAHFDRIQADDIAARVKLYADHGVAMEFVRELAAMPPCTHPCGNCIHCRARRWLHAEEPPSTVESATSDPARVQSDAPAQGERLRDSNSSSLVRSSSSLRTLVEKWRDFSRLALANADNERIPMLDRRQCFGVSQVYDRCADELAALLSPVAVEEKDEDTHTRTGEASTATDGAATASTEGEG